MQQTVLRPQLTEAELTGRLERLRAAMTEADIEAGVAYGSSYMPGDVQYLTGYDPQLEAAALLVTREHLLVIGGPEGEAMFDDQGLLGEWRNLDAFKIPGQQYDLRFWTLEEILREAMGAIPAKIAMLSAPNVTTWQLVATLGQLGVAPVDHSGILAELRYRKTPDELALHRVAAEIATAAMRSMLDLVRPGLTELEVAAAADATMKRLGAYATGFDTIVCSGPRIDTIIGRARPKVIEDGELVMLGASPRYEGYTSALGRTVVAGTATAEQRAFLDHGAAALELAATALIPGRPAREVDLAARRYLAEHGLGSYHAYGVGHGIGLSECLEPRTATAASDYDLPNGVTIMLDVGLFGHPVFVGARHEDPFLITHDGEVEHLTDLPMRVW